MQEHPRYGMASFFGGGAIAGLVHLPLLLEFQIPTRSKLQTVPRSWWREHVPEVARILNELVDCPSGQASP